LFKSKDILKSFNRIVKPISNDYIAEELANVVLKNGLISINRKNIEFILKSSETCEIYTCITPDSDYKQITYSYIFDDRNVYDAKYLIFIVKHNGILTKLNLSKIKDNIKWNLPNSQILLGDYIDETAKIITITVLILR